MASQSTQEKIEQKQRELEAKEIELEAINTQYNELFEKKHAIITENNDIKQKVQVLRNGLIDLEHEIDVLFRDVNRQINNRESTELFVYDAIDSLIKNATERVKSGELKNIEDEIKNISSKIKNWNPDVNLIAVEKYREEVDKLKKEKAEILRLEAKIVENEHKLDSIREPLRSLSRSKQIIQSVINNIKKVIQRLLGLLHARESMPQLPPPEPWRPLSTQEKISSYTKLLNIVGGQGYQFTPTGNTESEQLASIEAELNSKLIDSAYNTMIYFAGSNYNDLAMNYFTFYNDLINKYFGSDYPTFISDYGDYLDQIGASPDVKDELLKLYSPKLYNAAPPPSMFLCSGQDLRTLSPSGCAFYCEGCIFMCDDPTDSNGQKQTASHETGHYIDNYVIRGSDYSNPDFQSKINEASERIKQRLTQPGAKFKLLGKEFTLSEWKSGFWQQGPYCGFMSDMLNWLSSVIYSRFGFGPNSAEGIALRGQIVDTFQSILGFEYGAGHDRDYTTIKSDTSIEAVANIVSMINNGYDFIREPLMELYDEIYKEIK